MTTLQFHIPTAPISQQASGLNKAEIKSIIRTIISGTTFFLTGEVRLSLDWMIHERIRYETDTAPDVDNILKPTIDALTGPQGVLIDDCQIQRVNCGWIDITSEEQYFTIELEYLNDEKIPSRQLQFVQFENALCFPFDKNFPKEALERFVRHLVDRLRIRNEILEETNNYWEALKTMPIQRFFHRSRIGNFPVIDYKTIISDTTT